MIITIVRGLPGSGKSTLAKMMNTDMHIETDMYFMESGKYNFDATKLKEAHNWCQNRVEETMKQKKDIVVSNTFTQEWEAEPYFVLAEKYGYIVNVIECHGKFNNIHNIPEYVLEKMKARWEPTIDWERM